MFSKVAGLSGGNYDDLIVFLAKKWMKISMNASKKGMLLEKIIDDAIALIYKN